MEHKKTYINGKWIDGSSRKILQSVNPATEEVISDVVENNIEDTNLAISAARKSFYETREWRDLDTQSRSDILLKIADKIEENLDEIATLESMDNGKPLREAQADVDDAVHCFRYYARSYKNSCGWLLRCQH